MNAINYIKEQKTNEPLISGFKIIGHLTNKHDHKHLPYLFGILQSLKVNESKATGATRALVIHHIDPSQRTIARKHLPQVTLCSVQAQAKHPQTCAWVRVCLERSTIWVRVDDVPYSIYASSNLHTISTLYFACKAWLFVHIAACYTFIYSARRLYMPF